MTPGLLGFNIWENIVFFFFAKKIKQFESLLILKIPIIN